MTILEYELKKATLKTQINVLAKFQKEYPQDQDILSKKVGMSIKLNQLIHSQIPF